MFKGHPYQICVRVSVSLKGFLTNQTDFERNSLLTKLVVERLSLMDKHVFKGKP